MNAAISMRDVATVPQPLGPRIRVARENAGLSAEQTARRLGVRTATFEAWERDEKSPRANRLLTLAGLLNVNLSWLLEGRDAGHMDPGLELSPNALRSQVASIRLRLSETVNLVEDLERRLASLEYGEPVA